MNVPRIVVVGSVNTDMVVKSPRLPLPGETVTGGRFIMAAGGKGANQAVAAARLGAAVALVARVGTDVFGDQSISSLRGERIDTGHVFRDPDHATGVALILIDDRGENAISVASGANHALSPADIERAAGLVRAADVLMLQLEVPLATVAAAARIAADAGVPVILDPAPAVPLPAELLRRVTCLTPNEIEAERLSGVAVVDDASARQAALRLLEAGPRHVVITRGAAGALVADRDGVRLIPGTHVDAADTTAAGDAFNGGLAAALAAGEPLVEAVRRAAMVGALSVTKMGAQPSLPTAEEVRAFAARFQ